MIKRRKHIFKLENLCQFMNLSIQQPTTLIKIKNVHTVYRKEELKVNEKIDFYKFEFDFNGKKEKNISGMSDSGSYDGNSVVEDNSPFSYEQEECYNDESFLKMPLDLCPFDKSEEQNVSLVTERTKNILQKLNLNFVIENLKFDLRVKEYSINQDYVLVYFFCETDSLSFYRQYFKYLDLSFISNCDWFTATFAYSLDCSSENNTKEIQENKIQTEEQVVEKVYSRQRFENMVAKFNQLKSSFSKADLKAMLTDLDDRKTDFVFSNTKELAVGSKSNKIMQDAIKLMSGDEINRIYEKLEYDIVPISATKHGAYTIQTLLNYSTNNSHKKIISKYFAKEGEFLLSHEIGNYTFQKIISFDNKLACNFFLSNFQDVVKSELGLKVFKRCLEHLDEYKNDIFNKVNEYKELDMNVYTQLKQILKNL